MCVCVCVCVCVLPKQSISWGFQVWIWAGTFCSLFFHCSKIAPLLFIFGKRVFVCFLLHSMFWSSFCTVFFFFFSFFAHQCSASGFCSFHHHTPFLSFSCEYSVGSAGVDHDALVDLATKHFGKLPHDVSKVPKLTPCRYTGASVSFWFVLDFGWKSSLWFWICILCVPVWSQTVVVWAEVRFDSACVRFLW